MPEIVHIEPKHLTGKGGIGKGSQLRRGANPRLWEENHAKLDWNNYPKLK